MSALEYFEGDEVTLKFETDLDFKITYTYQGETETGKWKLGSNETNLEIQLITEKHIWNIEKLTANEFWFFDPVEDEHFKCTAK